MTTKIYHKLFEKYGSEPCREISERIDTELRWMLKKDYLDGLMRLDKFITGCKAWGEPYVATRTTPSSLVLNVLGITACNPLPPHYYCPNCKKVEFVNAYDGFALPEKVCECGDIMHGDGHNIPVEQFCKKIAKSPLAFHLSEKAYRRLPEYFEDFHEEPFGEDVIGVGDRACVFFINDYKYFKDKKINYSQETSVADLCRIGAEFVSDTYGVNVVENADFSDVLTAYGMAKGRRLVDVGVTITFLFREDLLNALLSRGVEAQTALGIVNAAGHGNGISEDGEKLLTDTEKAQIKKDRSIPIKATNVEWLCYIGRLGEMC